MRETARTLFGNETEFLIGVNGSYARRESADLGGIRSLAPIRIRGPRRYIGGDDGPRGADGQPAKPKFRWPLQPPFALSVASQHCRVGHIQAKWGQAATTRQRARSFTELKSRLPGHRGVKPRDARSGTVPVYLHPSRASRCCAAPARCPHRAGRRSAIASIAGGREPLEANLALHMIVVCRMHTDQLIRDYVERRTRWGCPSARSCAP